MIWNGTYILVVVLDYFLRDHFIWTPCEDHFLEIDGLIEWGWLTV
jgi:hypothetical protein